MASGPSPRCVSAGCDYACKPATSLPTPSDAYSAAALSSAMRPMRADKSFHAAATAKQRYIRGIAAFVSFPVRGRFQEV